MLSAQCSADGSVLSHRRRQHRLPPRSWSRSRHWSRAKATGSGWAPRAPCAACTAPATRHTRLDTATRRVRCGASSKETRRLSIGLGRSAWEQSAELRLQHPESPFLGLLGLLGPRHPPSSWRSPRRDATRSPEAEPEGRRSSPWALMALIPKGEKRARDSGTPDPPLELAGRGSLLLRVTQSPRKP